MRLLSAPERARLLDNGQIQAQAERNNPESSIDFYPVVKLFTPDAGCTWLLTEIDPDDSDRAFGLCDLGMGCPELGYVSLAELNAVCGRLGRPVDRDLDFRPSKTLSGCAAGAHVAGSIRA